MRILVVEDDQKVANFIQNGLEQEGCAVDVLREGTPAGDQARTIDYDAVILDLMLPGRSGFQVLHHFHGPDGNGPHGLIHSNGRLFGLTDVGGSSNEGVLFSLNDDGTAFTKLLDLGPATESIGRVG